VIELRGVYKRYGDRVALDDVTITVPAGVTGLLGPNGSGKSTLIKGLLGLVRIDRGQGQVLGQPWPAEARALRDRVGYLPEDDCYILGLQGIEAVQLAARLSGLPRIEALRRAHEVLDFCDVAQERYRTVETYSTGMRQKLKFAQALVHDPELVILDEPTTGLDPTQREEFLARIERLARDQGKAVLLSTHILPDVRQVCDQVIILVAGKVRVADTVENLRRPARPGVQITVSERASELAESLRGIGAHVEDLGSQRLQVAGLNAESSSEIWKLARQVKVTVQRFEPSQNSLEKAFMDAVREVDHADS
jgi:ABC-2 type transport system ATP-binding protein